MTARLQLLPSSLQLTAAEAGSGSPSLLGATLFLQVETSLRPSAFDCLTQRAFNRPEHQDEDLYLFVVLAEQELVEGREDQARYLIEAAYTAFDRRADA
jgi:hypothetical protein